MKRTKTNRKKDRRIYSKTADSTHKKNFAEKPKRGGWRL